MLYSVDKWHAYCGQILLWWSAQPHPWSDADHINHRVNKCDSVCLFVLISALTISNIVWQSRVVHKIKKPNLYCGVPCRWGLTVYISYPPSTDRLKVVVRCLTWHRSQQISFSLRIHCNQKLKARSTTNAQPVETTTDYKHRQRP